jgi:hypothetical protein
MEIKGLVEARKMAEAAVAGMADGPLKMTAFETILRRLLDADHEAGRPPQATPPARRAWPKGVGPGGVSPTGTVSRIMSLADDNFFKVQRSLAEIQTGLAERGWHYGQNNLSTPLARLVRKKLFRRTQVMDGTKKVWKYSVY